VKLCKALPRKHLGRGSGIGVRGGRERYREAAARAGVPGWVAVVATGPRVRLA